MDSLEERGWVSELPKVENPINLYPLQLMNVFRMEHNDFYFNANEVGCGKTIDAGLIALDYLWKEYEKYKADASYKIKRVLVITTVPLRDTEHFQNEWKSKLPFENAKIQTEKEERTLMDYICVRGNFHSEFDHWIKADDETYFYGLIIIDEVHKFLSSTLDFPNKIFYQVTALLRCEKLVLLSATPLKATYSYYWYEILARSLLEGREGCKPLPENWTNLSNSKKSGFDSWDVFQGNWESKFRIWNEDTRKELHAPWISLISAVNKEEHELICALCNPEHQVTRYFKDTYRFLETFTPPDGQLKNVTYSRREAAQLWYVENDQSKNEILFNHISYLRNMMPSSRFLVFTAYRDATEKRTETEKQEALNLVKFLQEKQRFEVKGIVAENKKDFSDYENVESDLPDILVVNYQVGEEGVNLPGFSHVINYNIPSNIYRLEQRFGRIDRITSCHEQLYICYLLRKNSDGSLALKDTNTKNFLWSVSNYFQDVLCHLPSRNTILSPELLTLYIQEKERLNQEYTILVDEFVEECKRKLSQIKEENYRWRKLTYQHGEFLPRFEKLFELFEIKDFSGKYDDLEDQFESLKDKLNSLKKIVNRSNYENTINLETLMDSIFYRTTEGGTELAGDLDDVAKKMDISVITTFDCGKLIQSTTEYKECMESFQKMISELLPEYSILNP